MNNNILDFIYWQQNRSIMKKLIEFGSISIIDSISAFLGIIFWLILASFLTTNGYGEIQMFIGIIALSIGISLIANNNTVIVFESKIRK